MTDRVVRMGDAVVQHGPSGDRVYVMKLQGADPVETLLQARALAAREGYGKVIAKCPASAVPALTALGFVVEAQVPRLFAADSHGAFVGSFLDQGRTVDPMKDRVASVLEAARARATPSPQPAPGPDLVTEAGPSDAPAIADCYARVFESYPFPIHDPDHLRAAMDEGTRFFTVSRDRQVVAAASMEDGGAPGVVEMTDFATLPDQRGEGLARHLLAHMDRCAAEAGIRVAFTIARAVSFGMNITFGRCGYRFGGTLINNTPIAGSLESMNVWYQHPAASDRVLLAQQRI